MVVSRNGLASNGQFIAQWRDDVLDNPDLSAGEKLTAMSIARFANCRTMSSYTSALKLAAIASCSERNILRHVKGLINKGYLGAQRKQTRQSQAWAKRELFLLRPLCHDKLSAPRADAPAKLSGPQARGPDKDDTEVLTITTEGPDTVADYPGKRSRKEIPGELAGARVPNRPASPLAENVCSQVLQLHESGVSDAEIAKRLRHAGHAMNQVMVRRVIESGPRTGVPQ